MPTIVITDKGGKRRRLDFNKPEVSIGRVQENDIVLPEANISKRHCRIAFRDDKFVITDLGSDTGTYVNGRKVTVSRPLKHGDKILIGNFTILVEEHEECIVKDFVEVEKQSLSDNAEAHVENIPLELDTRLDEIDTVTFLDPAAPTEEPEVINEDDLWSHDEEHATEFWDNIEQLSSNERATLLTSYLRREVARLTNLDPSVIDPMQSLVDIGLDSLVVTELRNQLQKTVGHELLPAATLLLQYPTISAIADYLADKTLAIPKETPHDVELQDMTGAMVEAPASVPSQGVSQRGQASRHDLGGEIAEMAREIGASIASSIGERIRTEVERQLDRLNRDIKSEFMTTPSGSTGRRPCDPQKEESSMRRPREYIRDIDTKETDEEGNRYRYKETGYDELPPDYQIPEDLRKYIKRPLEQVRFEVPEFVIGNERMIQRLIDEGYSAERAKESVADAIFPMPILTEEEEATRDAGFTKEFLESFQQYNELVRTRKGPE